MFNAIKKKNAKFTAFRTTISISGMISAVSTSACPELFRASLRVLMAKTSGHPGNRTFQPGLREFESPQDRLLRFDLYLGIYLGRIFVLNRIVVREVELIQQAMEITAADAQLHCSPQAVSRMHSQRCPH